MPAKDSNYVKAVSLLILLFIFIMIARNLSLQDVADDAYYVTVLDNTTLWNFIHSRYLEWSGRTLLEAIMVSTIQTPILWKIAIPGTLFFLVYQIWKLTLKNHCSPYIGSLAVIFLMFMMSSQVAAWGAWWVTGYYNYLLPVALGVFGFSVIVYQDKHSTLVKILGVFAIVIACQQEQVALALIASILVMCIYRKATGSSIYFELIAFTLGLTSLILLMSAPGNYHRFQAEISWLPDFVNMGLVDKLMLGVDRINAHATDASNRLLLIAIVMTLLATYLKNTPWHLKPVALALLCFFVFNILLSQQELDSYTNKLSFNSYIGPDHWYSYDIFISYSITLLVYGVMACSVIYIADRYDELLKYLGALALAVGVTMALAFSPTVYASGPRVLYLHDVLLVIYSCLMLSKIINIRALHKETKTPEAPFL